MSSPTARRLAIALASLVGLLILLVLLLPYVVSLDATRARAVAAAEAALHRKVEIGRMRLQLLPGPGAALEGVVVHNGPGYDTPALLSAERASVRVAFWPLLSKRLEVRKLSFDGVVVTVERSAAGKLNVSDFVSAGQRDSGPASQTAAAALLVSRVELDRGRVAFVDHETSPGQTATLALDDVTARLSDLGPSKPARFEIAARFLADKDRNLRLEGTLGPLPTAGPVGDAAVDARFSVRGAALGRLAPWVASFRDADPGALSLDGTAKGKALGALEIAGKLALDPPSGSARMPAVDGAIALTLDWPKGTLLIARSVFDVAELPLAVEGSVTSLHETPAVDLHVATPGDVGLDHVTGLPGVAGRFPEGFKISGSVRLDLRIQGTAAALTIRGAADAAPFAVARSGQPLFEAPSVHAGVETAGEGPLSGRVTASSGRLQNLPFENLRADWTWRRGVLTLTPSAGVFGGTLAGRVDSDFAHPNADAHVTLELRGVQAQPLVESLTTAKGVVSGVLAGKLAVTSRGLSWDAITKTGRGDGHVVLSDADLRTARLMPEVTRTLSAVGKVAGFQVPASLEDTRFSRLETSLKLADGRVSTPDLALSGRDVSATADGSIGLDKTLAYQGRVILGPSVVKSLGNASRWVADSSGRLALPFHVTGTIASPKVAIDESVAVELGKRALSGAAGKALGDALGGSGGQGANPLDVLQQLLKAPAPTPTPH
ncbi:MAG TPA: AsmA family protein [Thermoanaerobaculia bacterium]|nr:AsmA family protein [Thermoanaerobaculia bacterium]